MLDVVVTSQDNHNIGMPWWEAGFSVVPIRADGSKRPARDWSILQRTRLTRPEVIGYWQSPGFGVAVICGQVSGNLEMTELEALATDNTSMQKIYTECELRGIRELWERLLQDGYAEWTPSGGLHLLYLIEDHEVPGNTKLAANAGGQVLAETRGEGGYVIVAPSPGACHPSGEPWSLVTGQLGQVPTITWSQRQSIHSAIKAALDETPPPAPITPRREIMPMVNPGTRPGDILNDTMDWAVILEPAGWTYSHSVGDERFWTRPGKSVRDGHSASTGYRGEKDRMYVWSTDAGLPTEEPLTKFFVYAHYNHGGDLSMAARMLAKWGPVPVATVELDTYTPSPVALPPRTGYLPSETGNGQRMKDEYGNVFAWCGPEKRWYYWNGRVWGEDRRQEIKRAAEAMTYTLVDHAQKLAEEAEGDKVLLRQADKAMAFAMLSQSEAKLNAAIARFSAQPGVSVVPEDFDKDQDLLNLANGVFNLATMEFGPHSPEHMLTMEFGASYKPGASCPKFEQFMIDVMPDPEVREYVQRALGYTLLGRPTERAMFLLHGESGTGKSVLTNLLTRLFGGYGQTAPAATFRIKKNETSLDLHQLRGKRFVATSEMPEGAQLDEELFKRVTGGDMVSSRAHYEDYQTWTPQCVVWIATNFLPRVSSDDNAIWRRAKTIKMGTRFGEGGREEIYGYADHLIEEADGILNWLLRGLASYRELGLKEPGSVTQAIQDYRTDVDSVASFLRDQIAEGVLEETDGGFVLSSRMLSLYDRYCQDQRIIPLGGMRFAQRMKSLGFPSEKVGGVRRYGQLNQTPALHGFLGSWSSG